MQDNWLLKGLTGKESWIELKWKYELLNRVDLVKHIFVIFAGLIVLFWTLYLMVSPLKFALGLVLFSIAIIVGELLLPGSLGQRNTESQSKLSRLSHGILVADVVAVIFALSLATIFLVPANKGEIFVEWGTLELPNVVRMIAAFGLNFFPGYLCLTIAGRQELSKLSKLITSYFLSMFVMTVTGFVTARVIGIIDEFFLNAFLFVCAALVVVYALKRSIYRKSRLENPITSVSSMGSRKMLSTLLVGLTIAFMAIWLSWMYSNIGFFIGTRGTDMWRVHGAAQTFMDYQAFRWLHVPWMFYLYLGCYMVVSGAPSANAYLTLYPLIIIPVLSFYYMTSNFLKDKRIASLATLSYAIFSGPAWLYALYLRNFSPVIDYDSWIKIISETGDKFLLQGWYPPYVVGFTSAVVGYATLWWLIYAIWRLDVRRKFNFFLMTTIFSLSYMFHGVDALVYMVYLAAFLIVCFLSQNIDGKKRVRYATFSAFAGLGIVALIDISLTAQYDYFNSISIWALSSRYYYFNSPSFYALVLASTLILALTYGSFFDNRLIQIYRLIREKLKPEYVALAKRRLSEIIFCFFGVSLVVFIVLFRDLTIAETGLGWVPWYVYPIIGGIPTFLGLAGIALVLRTWNSGETIGRDALVFCALSIVLLFIFGQITSFVNEEFFYTGYWERRTLSYIHPVISILMAYALVTIFRRLPVKGASNIRYLTKIGIFLLLTSLILLSSVSSTLIAGDFASRVFFATRPTEEEMEALRFLHYSLPEGFKTAYLNRLTGTDYIRAFANDKWTDDINLWLGRTRSPSVILSSIRKGDIKFLYLNRIRDLPDLKKDAFIQQLIKVLPIVFTNSEVTIYSIPSLRLPSQLSSLGVITPEEETGDSYDAYALWFFALMASGFSYMAIENASDVAVLSAAESILIPYDPLPIGRESEQLLDWVSSGGHLVVSNTNQYGLFSELLGLTSKFSLVSCDSTLNWKTFYKRGEISLETNLKVEGEASLRLQNNLSAFEGWIYTPPMSWDLSQYEYLGVWVYGTGGGPQWALFLTDSDGNENYYRIFLSSLDRETQTYVPSFIGWRRLLIPINDYYGSLNLSSIRQLRIVTGYQLSLDILIDDIFVLERRGEEHLAVYADSIEGTVSIDLPNIEVESVAPSISSEIIANYTQDGFPVAPFALQKDFGSGKVTYLNINLLYQSILSESTVFTSPHETLTKILEIIGIQKPP